MAVIVNGREIANEVLGGLAAKVERRPTLAVVVSDDPAAVSYTRSIVKQGKAVDVDVKVIALPSEKETGRFQLLSLATDDVINGIILQKPFVDREVDAALAELIPVQKDVDGQTSASAGLLWSGKNCFVPSTALAAIRILEHYEVEFSGAEAVVIGRSPVIGKPVASLLLSRNSTVTLCHTRTQDLETHTKRADIIILGAGKAGLLTGEMIKPGTAVIDCGYNYVDGKTVGDADFDSVAQVASITNKALGGVGPVTTAILLEQVVAASSGKYEV